MDNFVKVFDVADAGFRTWMFSAYGVIFIAFGAIPLIFQIIFRRILRATGLPNLNFKSGFLSWSSTLLRYAVIGLGTLVTVFVLFETYSTYLNQRELVEQNRCRVVEGLVRNFVPYDGRGQEYFEVAGVPFKYFDFNTTGGFNNTSAHGGPVSSNSYVRVCYDPAGNVILRLEIRDFKGDPKDYSKSSLFPRPAQGDIRNINGVEMPWYGNLFIVFFILDVLVIRALYVPYLRTFFRLKTTTVGDVAIPLSVTRGEKIKLRNSVIYWDAGTQAIWLRPRGGNLFKALFMAGRLNADANGRSITATQILFSSGFPFIVALLLWTIYQAISAARPAGSAGLEPVLVVGTFAVIILVAGIIKLRRLRSRMAELIDDAVCDIRDM